MVMQGKSVRPTKKRLTARQKAVLDFVRDYIERNHFAPSVREIAEHFRLASPSGAAKHLHALEDKGLIRTHSTARSIEVLQPPSLPSEGIPILGRVPAGTPLLAIQDFDGSLSFKELYGESGNLFSLRVKGDSMTGAGILDGDFVIVRAQPEVESGQIGVALVGEEYEATVKRIFIERNGVRLEPENPTFEPRFFAKDDGHFRILGKVIGIVRKL
jgi:repressor LexA